jgi:hypothetical protein
MRAKRCCTDDNRDVWLAGTFPDSAAADAKPLAGKNKRKVTGPYIRLNILIYHALILNSGCPCADGWLLLLTRDEVPEIWDTQLETVSLNKRGPRLEKLRRL